jgi:hypothetical protein
MTDEARHTRGPSTGTNVSPEHPARCCHRERLSSQRPVASLLVKTGCARQRRAVKFDDGTQALHRRASRPADTTPASEGRVHELQTPPQHLPGPLQSSHGAGAGGPSLALAPPDSRLGCAIDGVATADVALAPRRKCLRAGRVRRRPRRPVTRSPRCCHRGSETPPTTTVAEARNPSRELPRPALSPPSTLSVGYTTTFASCPTKTAACQ